MLHFLHSDDLSTEQLMKMEGLYLKITKKKGSSCDGSGQLLLLSSPSAVNDMAGCLALLTLLALFHELAITTR